MSRRERACIALAIGCAALLGAAGMRRAVADPGYDSYSSWRDWARLQPGVHAGLASSYDRSGLNQDYCYYESPPGLVTTNALATIVTLDGPGVIHRFWMPHRTANLGFVVRFFFDGETTPRIDTTSDTIFGEAFSYFSAPLLYTCAGGQVSYEPIFFADSLRIETVNMSEPSEPTMCKRHYYQYSFSFLPPSSAIESYTGTLTANQQAAHDAVAYLFEHAGSHPAGESATAIDIGTTGASVAPGTCLSLAALDGPAIVRQLVVQMDSATDAELDGLALRITFDDASAAAIDVPISDFFGAGHGRAPYESLPLGVGSNGYYCFWPMPFRESATVELCNTTTAAITVDAAGIEYEPGPISADMCYLHAEVNAHVRGPGDIYHQILSVTGRGHYVGNLLFIEQDSYSFKFLEGDDVITVDDDAVLAGTGLEDAYNGGYYYNWVGIEFDEPEGPMPQSATRPLGGALYVHRETGVEHARADQYRWLIGDRVSFESSIDVKIENRYAIEGASWKSVAFWYEQPPVRGDMDHDGDLDLADYAALARCFGAGDASCLEHFDYDGDSTVGPDDYATFSASVSGPL